MKRIILNIAVLAAICSLFTSCDTDIEAMVIQKPFEYTEEYYENLRAYKSTYKERSVCFVWFSEYTSNTFRFAALPDSVDICSLWGGIPDPVQHPTAYKEMWEMRNKKGTLLVAPTIIRIMENENYANFGLTYEDMVNQKTTIDPEGIYPDWCVLYGNHLLQEMWESGIDGLDLDYEPESGDEQDYGIYNGYSYNLGIYRYTLDLFVEYLGQFIGPMSPNPDKLLIVDGHNPGSDCEPYLDYWVRQTYTSTDWDFDRNPTRSFSFVSGIPHEKQVFTENIGDHWKNGGFLISMAEFKSTTGFKGGFGAFYVNRDYHTTDSGANKALPYGTVRSAIQVQNPAVTE